MEIRAFIDCLWPSVQKRIPAFKTRNKIKKEEIGCNIAVVR